MVLQPIKPWWRRRRLWWPLAAAAVLGAAFWFALVRADTSRIVVYNNTGEAIEELTVAACGQSRTFRGVEADSSVRFKLAPTGGESAIAISTNSAVLWQGDYIEARGGYYAIVRLNRDGDVECHTSLQAWW